MKTMGISQFKTQALRVLDEVANSKETVVITKRGKPLAGIAPYRISSKYNKPGRLADTLLFEKDIVSPLGNKMWEAYK